jgi:hypothetical protein
MIDRTETNEAMCVVDHSNDFRLESGLLDSGASFHSVPERLAHKFNLKKWKYDKPFTTQFANGDTMSIREGVQVADHTVALMPGNAQPLISVKEIVNRGNSIHLYHDRVTIDANNNECHIEFSRNEDGMWYVPYDILLQLSKNQKVNGTNEESFSPPLNVSEGEDQIVNYETSNSGREISLGTEVERVMRLHERMGHPPQDIMCIAVSSETPTWQHTEIDVAVIQCTFGKQQCLWCILCKRNLEPPISKQTSLQVANKIPQADEQYTSKYQPGECLSFDDNGPVNPADYHDCHYWLLVKDVATGMKFAYISKGAITSAFFLKSFEEIRCYFKRFGKVVTTARGDYAKKFLSEEVIQYYQQHNIESQSSAPYQHYQNSVERDVQSMIKKTSTLLHAQPWLSTRMWSAALLHAVDLDCDTPRISTGISPRQIVDIC